MPCRTLKAEDAYFRLKAKKIDPRKIFVIQHGLDKVSSQLIKKGAVPFMLIMFESPLYAGKFYDEMNQLQNQFIYSQIFSPLVNESNKLRSVRFPSFSHSTISISRSLNWDDRKFASMVLANKYVALQTVKSVDSIESFIWIIANKLRDLLRGNPAPRSIDLSASQVQDKRLEAIIYFNEVGKLDLYGRGWSSLWRIPPKYRKRLELLLTNKIDPVDNKIDCIAKYKFNFCFENVRYPGYVTEKIFDALVANTIPIYFGAPDIADFVPQEAFIDAAKYSSWDELYHFMSNLSSAEAATILESGKTFLFSKKGVQFSKEDVVFRINKKISTYINSQKDI